MTSFHRSDWIGLAQAVGGMLAVGAAALVPFLHGLFQDRRSRRARMATLIALLDMATILLNDLDEALESEIALLGFQHFGVMRDWQEIEDALGAFPIWDLPEAMVAVQVGYARGAVSRGHGFARYAMEVRNINEPAVKDALGYVRDCIDDVSRARAAFNYTLQ